MTKLERWIEDHAQAVNRWSARAIGVLTVVTALVFGFWPAVIVFVAGTVGCLAGLCASEETSR